ncbi:unnamed protein product [Pieris brassicae]|uniref:Uncharacterized protein n=1 Tax=Pieris brassicae TaxID=7116 RepID=A0A9P0TDV1_PIEBR|nr:unnamed protein product [Pieris brassicae]
MAEKSFGDKGSPLDPIYLAGRRRKRRRQPRRRVSPLGTPGRAGLEASRPVPAASRAQVHSEEQHESGDGQRLPNALELERREPDERAVRERVQHVGVGGDHGVRRARRARRPDAPRARIVLRRDGHQAPAVAAVPGGRRSRQARVLPRASLGAASGTSRLVASPFGRPRRTERGPRPVPGGGREHAGRGRRRSGARFAVGRAYAGRHRRPGGVQRPSNASPGGAASEGGAGAGPGASVLQGEDEDVRSRVRRGLDAQGQGEDLSGPARHRRGALAAAASRRRGTPLRLTPVAWRRPLGSDSENNDQREFCSLSRFLTFQRTN